MKLLITISSRYYRTPDGRIWTTSSYDYGMWKEHLEVFDEVSVLTRVIDVGSQPSGARRADGPGVTFHGLPEWRSLYLPLLIHRLFGIAQRVVAEHDVLLLHSPSLESTLAFVWAGKWGKPIAIECRGEQSMKRQYWVSRGLPMPLASVLARFFHARFTQHLGRSWGCVFVSKELCQRYVSFLPDPSHCEVISDLRLPDEFFGCPRAYSPGRKKTWRIVHVGRLATEKGQTTLLRACALLSRLQVSDWELHLIGDGPQRRALERAAAGLGIRKQVAFHGFVPWGESLFALLDQMDLFVLSSTYEGMPRALLEAMARGLPCISTRVSGATELLDDESLVPVGDAEALARCMAGFLLSQDRMNELAQKCWRRVQNFRADTLRRRHQAFLREFRDAIRKRG